MKNDVQRSEHIAFVYQFMRTYPCLTSATVKEQAHVKIQCYMPVIVQIARTLFYCYTLQFEDIGTSNLEEFSEMNNCYNELLGEHIIKLQ